MAQLGLFFCVFTVNEYVFMVQARGIQIRENVKNIGVQALERVVRGAYSINGTGKNAHVQAKKILFIKPIRTTDIYSITLASIRSQSPDSRPLIIIPDYSYDFNFSESDAPPTTYLPEGFTYLPSQVCPERLPSMSKLRLSFSFNNILRF